MSNIINIDDYRKKSYPIEECLCEKCDYLIDERFCQIIEVNEPANSNTK